MEQKEIVCYKIMPDGTMKKTVYYGVLYTPALRKKYYTGGDKYKLYYDKELEMFKGYIDTACLMKNMDDAYIKSVDIKRKSTIWTIGENDEKVRQIVRRQYQKKYEECMKKKEELDEKIANIRRVMDSL